MIGNVIVFFFTRIIRTVFFFEEPNESESNDRTKKDNRSFLTDDFF